MSRVIVVILCVCVLSGIWVIVGDAHGLHCICWLVMLSMRLDDRLSRISMCQYTKTYITVRRCASIFGGVASILMRLPFIAFLWLAVDRHGKCELTSLEWNFISHRDELEC